MGDSAASQVKDALQTLASPEKAKASAWFFKTGPGQYGAGDRFIGVTVPQQRLVARQFRDLPLGEVQRLLQSPIHEHRLTALFILVDQYRRATKISPRPRLHDPVGQASLTKRGNPPFAKGRLGGILAGSTRRVEPREIVECYLRNLDQINNWDLVDSSAPYILGDWLVCHPELVEGSQRFFGLGPQNDEQMADTILLTLAKSTNVWRRRIAMLTCGGMIRVGQFDDALAIAEILVHDPHDLIQKAVGWMLREIGNRDHAVELKFLNQYAATMPRTMLRYAIEKFPSNLRTDFLKRATNYRVTRKKSGENNF